MARSASDVTKASNARRGVTSTSFKFTPEERARLDRLAEEHGGMKAAILAGLDALESRDLSDEAILEALAARLKLRRQP